MTFDELRDTFPDLGFALYAIEPGGVVTLEVYDSGRVFPFVGPIGSTAQDVIDIAFPPPSEEHVDQMADLVEEGLAMLDYKFSFEQKESVFD